MMQLELPIFYGKHINSIVNVVSYNKYGDLADKRER